MASVRHLIRWTEPSVVPPKIRSHYNDYTMNFLWDLSLADYVTIDQASWMYGAPRSTTLHNLRHWRKRGLIQAAWVPYHGQRTRIIALAPGGVDLLRDDDDKGWDMLHPNWVPVSERVRTNRLVEHNLDRNTAALTLKRKAETLGLSASWDLWMTELIVPGRDSLWIKPDAFIRLNDHPCVIELERSWRKETLLHKFAQYDRCILQGGWRQISWCNEPPKVLFIPTAANTQQKNWQTWMTTFQFHQHSYAWIWPWPHVAAGRFTVYGGDGDPVIQARDLWAMMRQPAYRERR
jgi:hypothetical protein